MWVTIYIFDIKNEHLQNKYTFLDPARTFHFVLLH